MSDFSGSIHIINLPENSSPQTALSNLLMSPVTATGYVSLVPESTAVLESIFADPHAIGYIPTRWDNVTLKTIEISDLPDGLAEIPILAYLPEDPDAVQQDWMVCVEQAILIK